MPTAYTKIATVTVTTATQAAIEFTSIPATYTDLMILLSARSASSDVFGQVNFNNNTSNFSSKRLEGDGSAAGSASRSDDLAQIQANSSRTANVFGNTSIYIPNYASSTNKSVSINFVEENNSTQSQICSTAFLWSNTAAITSIKLTDGGNYTQYSSATLYGIKKN